MHRPSAFLWSLALLALALPGVARGQALDARRMGMGGVVLGSGGTGANVAYDAVPAPRSRDEGRSLALPLGLIQLLADPPELDPDDPDFNAFELANLLYNPPWHLQLVKPDAPSGDVTISVAKNSLAVDLAELHELFPEEGTQFGGVAGSGGFSVAVGRFSLGIAPLIHDQNKLTLNDALQGALARGEPFVPNTDYVMNDAGRGQAAVGLQAGYAQRLLGAGDDPRAAGGWGIYAGARAKALRGLAYGDVTGDVGFTTPDTLFGSSSVVLDYHALMRTAGPGDGGLGYGLDLGAVWVAGGTELGVGVNNVATRLPWKTLVREAYRDTATGNYVMAELARDQRFTSTVPATVTLNVAQRMGPWLLAADAVQGVLRWSGHAGAETWFGNLAVRGGLTYDQNRMVQYSLGGGLRLGRVGLDAALATNSRNLTRERGLELGLGLTVY